jgi:hypothetical protein
VQLVRRSSTYIVNDVSLLLLVRARFVASQVGHLLGLRLRAHQVHLVVVVLFLVDIEYMVRVVDAESVCVFDGVVGGGVESVG